MKGFSVSRLGPFALLGCTSLLVDRSLERPVGLQAVCGAVLMVVVTVLDIWASEVQSRF